MKSQYDIILISGDAYIDHPYFGAALIKRFLESKGFSVAVIEQPEWRSGKYQDQSKADFTKFGKPKLFFGVTAGNLDSMLANYTPMKKLREKDYYSPEGIAGKRPDRAITVYCNRIKEFFKNETNINNEKIPIIIGGIEASLRRFTHYDYWDNAIRKSILADSRAEILCYGMSEYAILEIAEKIKKGKKVNEIVDVKNTCYKSKTLPADVKIMKILPSFDKIKGEDKDSKLKFNEAFKIFYENNNLNEFIAQKQDDKSEFYIIQNPMKILTTKELDYVYELPFTRKLSKDSAYIPALESVRFSVLSHRGCFGKCAFCSLFFHQGKIIQSKSKESILKEIKLLVKHPDFKGFIDDLGGPSANMYGLECAGCKDNMKSCLNCETMKNNTLKKNSNKYSELLKEADKIPGVKKVYVRSGLRLELINKLDEEEREKFLYELCKNNISGRLKVAPEHVNNEVLRIMNKGSKTEWIKFLALFKKTQSKLKKENINVQVLPYFMAAHPGCSIKEMKELKAFIEDFGEVDQVQVFTPTPMTLSSCIYWTSIHPFTNEKVYVPYAYTEKKLQKAMLHPFKTENRKRLAQLNEPDDEIDEED